MAPPRGPFDPEPQPFAVSALPAGSVMLATLVPVILPVIATHPILPPLAMMMFVGWRLARPEAIPIWAPPLLGLFDDLFSGQPLGSAMLLWSLIWLTCDLIDQRLVARDFWQDWLIAGGAIAGYLILGRLIATPFSAHVDTILLLQIIVSVMLYPVAVRLIAWLDRKRNPA